MKIVDVVQFHRLLCGVHVLPALRYGKLLALDVGTKKIGLALTDESRRLINPMDTFLRTEDKSMKYQDNALTNKLQRVIESEGVVGVIVGFPLGVNAEVTPLCQDIVQLIQSLRCVYPKTGVIGNAANTSLRVDPLSSISNAHQQSHAESIPMIATFWDERNSSVQARRLARTISDRKGVAKKYKDTFAACLILEGFLENVVFARDSLR
jgi:RNase H-fold protein (predicted Holliday junction resolvase)